MRSRLFRVTGTLQSKFMISVSLLLVFLMLITIVAMDHRLTGLLLRLTNERADAVAHAFGAAISNSLVTLDTRTLREAAEKAIEEEDIVYVFVTDRNGALVAASQRPGLHGLSARTESMESALHSGSNSVHPEEVELDGKLIQVMDIVQRVTLDESGYVWGHVGIGLSLESMRGAIHGIRLILVLIGLCGVGLGIIGARLISRRITASLDDVVRGTIAVAQGDLDHRIPVAAHHEIATVAEHFNHMTEQVKRQQEEIAVATHELEMLNATLEEKVSLRNQEFFASEEKYRILIENSPDPILISQGGRIRFVNPAFERVFGYSFGGVVHESFPSEELFHPDDRELGREYLKRIVDGEHVEAGEIRGLTKEGGIRLFEMRGMWITYLGDPAVEVILMDMTEKKELQDHLLQHEKLRALGELASGVAHDFNNILGIILGRSQLLQTRINDPEIQKGLRTIERAAFDGGETVRRIQDFARSRTARDFEDVDLNSLLEEIVEITRTRWKDEAEVRDVKIEVHLDLAAVPNIKGSPSELREVYTNLVFNAVDAMPGGGAIYIKSFAEGEEAVVEFQDTGRGMKEHIRARVFDPFFTTKTNGMGLGMSVVYGIIERHGGRIAVESTPGAGTSFVIRVPGSAKSAAAAAPEPVPAAEESARILLIDDEHEVLELVCDILEMNDFSVRTALSGPAALESFGPGQFDLVFCDLGMREMSGWEVVRALRSREPDIPVVLLTGWGATLSGQKVASHGIDAVVSKPFEMQKILSTVTEVLSARGAARAAR